MDQINNKLNIEGLNNHCIKENWVILMAGGIGSRLKPLTNNCPKPMLLIGGKPVLEIILNNFIEQGFYKFYFSINYKGEQIQNYFGDGSKWGVQIHYIQEKMRMGTAGSLSLLSIKTNEPIIVMNADVLTKINFDELINFHIEGQADATVVVYNYNFEFPYGVVKVNKNKLIGFEEKPIYRNFINGGVYVINPYILNKIPKNSYFDMNQLLDNMLSNNEQILIFPITEYWIDIGEIENFEQAKSDFYEVFK